MTRRTALVLPLLAAALLAGCGSSSSSSHSTGYPPATAATSTPATTSAPATAAAPAAVTATKVSISNYKFAPATIAVKRGSSITFTNQDPTGHTATANDGSSFDTGTLQQGQSKKLTFSKAGTFPYHCVFHAFMTGSVVVS